MQKKLIHIAHKNFLTVRKNEKKTECLKSVVKCNRSVVESGTQCHRQLGPKKIPLGHSVQMCPYDLLFGMQIQNFEWTDYHK
jgi:hypothetical protein